jgi:hypothetical protein
MDHETTENAVSMEPSSDITFIWPEHNRLTIYTGGAFRAETTYQISIDSTAEDLDGIRLGSPFSFSFSTSSVGLNYTSPHSGELFVSKNSDIRLSFNSYMVKSSVQNAISISPEINGSLNWYNDSKTTMEFTPYGSLKANTKYTVTIGTGARDIFGSTLKEPYSFSFITRPD